VKFFFQRFLKSAKFIYIAQTGHHTWVGSGDFFAHERGEFSFVWIICSQPNVEYSWNQTDVP